MKFVLDEAIETLQKNFVFNSSLGSKELFHSNLLAMLLMQNDSCDELLKSVAQELANFFKPTGNTSEKYRVISVFREFHNFDLSIAYLDEDFYEQIKSMEHGEAILEALRNATETLSLKDLEANTESSQLQDILKILQQNCKFVIVENKFKSIPEDLQLCEYICKVNRKIPYICAGKSSVKINLENTTFYLLTPNYPARDMPDILSTWKQIYYAHIIKKIDNSIDKFGKENSFSTRYLKEYCEMLRLHIWISTEITLFQKMHKAVFPEKLFSDKLDLIRLKDFFEKAWFSKLAYHLGVFWPKEENVIKEIGYTNGHGMIGFRNVPHDGSRITFGVEMQNKMFRFYVQPLPAKYYRAVELDEKIRQGHLPDNRTKTYHWTNFDKDSFYKVLDKARKDTLREINDEGFIVDVPQALNKFNDFKYVYVKLSDETSQKQLVELSKIALEKLGKMIQKNRDLFKVQSKTNKFM